MLLTFDRRGELKGHATAHALVVGISRYPHLPLKTAAGEAAQLTPLKFAARTASVFANWLVQNSDRLSAPLATCRVLVAPSAEELKELPPDWVDKAGPCRVADFLEAASAWRRDAVENPENALIFYFAGHALELTRQQPALVFEDFGDDIGPTLRATVSLSNLLGGLVPCDWQPKIARQQFLFIDSDRIGTEGLDLGSLWRTTDVFDVPRVATFDDRSACVLYGTAAGGSAYAFPTHGTFFHIALMKCLNGEAAEPAPPDLIDGSTAWRITIRSLVHGVQAGLDRINSAMKADPPQRATWSILGDDAVLVEIGQPPEATLFLQVHPPSLLPQVRIDVLNDRLEPVFHQDQDPKRDPATGAKLKLLAGLYQVRVSIGEGGAARSWERFVPVRPPQ